MSNTQPDLFSKNFNRALDKKGYSIRGRAREVQERLSYDLSLVAIRKWLVGESIPSNSRDDDIYSICGHRISELLIADNDLPSTEQDHVQSINAPSSGRTFAKADDIKIIEGASELIVRTILEMTNDGWVVQGDIVFTHVLNGVPQYSQTLLKHV